MDITDTPRLAFIGNTGTAAANPPLTQPGTRAESPVMTRPRAASTSPLRDDSSFPSRGSSWNDPVTQRQLEDVVTDLAATSRSLADVKSFLVNISLLPVPSRGRPLEALWAQIDSLPVGERRLATELIVASTHDILGTLSTNLWNLVTDAKLRAATEAAKNGATVQEAVQKYGRPSDRSHIEAEIVRRVAIPAIAAGESVEAVVERLGITNEQRIAGLHAHSELEKAGGWSRFERAKS